MPTAYEKEERGKIEVKGKGEMTTFWINGKSGRSAPTKDEVSIGEIRFYYLRFYNQSIFLCLLGMMNMLIYLFQVFPKDPADEKAAEEAAKE